VIKIARYVASYEILVWWFFVETPGSGCSGLYQDSGLCSRRFLL